jgi:eukaryotic-like serine/threonine-protein kinase
LQVAAGGTDRARMLEAARRLTGKIERERTTWAAPFVPLAQAAIADLEGRRDAAIPLVDGAARGFEAADMGLHAAVARRRLGQLIGGDEGAALVRAAELWMMDQRIVNVEGMTQLLAPGFARIREA